MAEVDCCDVDLSKINVHEHGSKAHKKKATMFEWANKRNPLQEQIKDTEQLKWTFERYPLIPFAGTSFWSGHSLLSFMLSMTANSTTHGACIVSQRKFAFGGKLQVTKNADSIFDFEEETVSDELKKKFSKFIKTIRLNTTDIKQLSENIFTSYKATGNAYFTMTRSETLGVKSVSLNFYQPDTCCYIDTKKSQDKLIAISNCWEYDYLEKNPPTIVPLYPNFIKRRSGEEVTMFHLKDTTDWYGRPDSISSYLYQYREFQDVNYLMLECDNGFTGKVFIEVEDGDPELDDVDAPDQLDDIIEQFENSFTNKGDNPLSIMFMTRPTGAQQAYIHQFKPNTNEKFFEISSDISERKILISHSWSARLLGESKAAGLSTNLFTDELESKLPLLEGYQTTIENILNMAIAECTTYMGETELDGMGVKFSTPFEVIMSTTRDLRAGKDMNAEQSVFDEQ